MIYSKSQFSVLNDYAYADKSFGMKILDVLSSPARNLLGGRRVNLVALVLEDTSTPQKVAHLALLIIVPIALVSFASLLVKKIVSKSHRDSVDKSFDKAEEAIKSFPNDLKGAFDEVKKNPEILKNPTVEEKYLSLIKEYIAEIPILLIEHIDVLKKCIEPFSSGQKLFNALFVVLKKWIEKDIKNANPISKPIDHKGLILHFYKGFNNSERNLLYKKICDDVLRITEEDTLYKKAIKFNLLSAFLEEFVEHLSLPLYCGPVTDQVDYVSRLMLGLFGVYHDPAQKETLLKAIDKIYQVNAWQAIEELGRYDSLTWEILRDKWNTIRYHLLNSLDPITENQKKAALLERIKLIDTDLSSKKSTFTTDLLQLKRFAQNDIFNCPINSNKPDKDILAYVLNARGHILDWFIHKYWDKRATLC